MALIGPSDRIGLPPGVELTSAGLVDHVRGTTVALNDAARTVVASETPAAAALALAHGAGVAGERVLGDVLAVCRQLNAALLLDVRPRRGRAVHALGRLAMLPASLPRGRVPAPLATRRPLAPGTVRGIVALAQAFGPSALAHGLGAVAATIVLVPLDGASLGLLLAVGTAVAAGLLLHELAHLLALGPVPACLVVRGLRVSILHRSVGRAAEARVAAAGPAAGVAAAALTACIAQRAGAPFAAAAAVLALQTLGLTVLCADGRRACGLR